MENRAKVLIAIILVVIFSFILMNVLVPTSNEQGFNNSENREGTILSGFLAKYLKDEFVPVWMNVEQGMTPNGKIGPDSLYGYNWEINGVKLYVSTEYNSNNSGVLKNLIRIYDSFREMNAEMATRILDTYFKTHEDVKCANTPAIKSLYCESYLRDGDNKIFIGALSANFTDESIAFVCEYPVGSDIYSWNSCNKAFKEIGVATLPYTLPGA